MKSKDELLDEIDANVKVLNDVTDEDPDETTKQIVCPFYKKGNAPGCRGCSQGTDRLVVCKDEYLNRIYHRPMEIWDDSFYGIEVREKKKLSAISRPIGLTCDKCYLSENCPEFKALSSCAIDWGQDIDTDKPKDLLARLIKLQHERIEIARAAELVDGGIPDQNLSNEMDRLSGLITTQNELLQDKFSLKIEGTAQGNGGGILSQIFGGMAGGNKELPKNEVQTIDIPAQEVKPAIDVTSALQNIKFDENVLEPEKKTRRRGEKPL